MNFKILKTGNVVGSLAILFFLACMVWGTFLTDPVLKELHLNFLRITYPGFSMSFLGAVIGIIESFVYGWVFGALFAWLCRKACVLGEHRNG
jgi:hypothetical protein